MSKRALYTTGYAGFDQDTFLWKIKNNGVEIVVDVRDKPISRNRGFSQSTLQPYLEKQGIRYVHQKELGVPEELRKQLKNGGNLKDYFAAFRKYLRKQDDALGSLYELASAKTCCLMCLETKPEECHRSVVADALVRRNGKSLEVIHI